MSHIIDNQPTEKKKSVIKKDNECIIRSCNYFYPYFKDITHCPPNKKGKRMKPYLPETIINAPARLTIARSFPWQRMKFNYQIAKQAELTISKLTSKSCIFEIAPANTFNFFFKKRYCICQSYREAT